MTVIDWNDLRYVLAIQRAGTLARAAAELGINATTVGRRLTSLEEQVAARLFDRTKDGYVLTHAGRDLLAHAERMEREVLAVEREVSGADRRAAGLVRLSTTEMLVTRFLGPYLPRFHARHPEVTLDVACTLRSVSLGRRDADVVLRLSRPREDDVVARRLATVPLSLYAAPAYVAEHGRPKRPDRSLRGHRVLMFAAVRAFAVENTWLEARLDGAQVVLRSDSVSSVYAAAVAGAGIALLPRRVADAEAGLVALETRSAPEPREIWQAVHRDLLRSARVKAVLDFLAEVVAAEGDAG
jgi:DNA-binding transcriptional LysR family regulator